MNIFPGPLKKEMNQTDPLDEILDGLTKNIMANRKADNPPQGRQMLLAEAEAAINAEIAKAEIKLLDRIYELSPKAVFGDWKPQDAMAFYDRLKVLEVEIKARLPHEI